MRSSISRAARRKRHAARAATRADQACRDKGNPGSGRRLDPIWSGLGPL